MNNHLHLIAEKIVNQSLKQKIEYFDLTHDDHKDDGSYWTSLLNYPFPDNISSLHELPFSEAYSILKAKIQAEENCLKDYLDSNRETLPLDFIASHKDKPSDVMLLYIVYFQLGCIYLKEAFAVDPERTFKSKTSCYLIEEAHTYFTKSIEFLYNSDVSFNNYHVFFLNGYTSFIRQSTTSCAINNLLSVVNNVYSCDYYCTDYSDIVICSLYMLCIMTNGSPAAVIHFRTLVEECKKVRTELLTYTFIKAQELTLEPSNPNYYLFSSFKFIFKNLTSEGIECLKEGLKLQPNVFEYYYYLHFFTKDQYYRIIGNDLVRKHFNNELKLSRLLDGNPIHFIENCDIKHSFVKERKMLTLIDLYICCQEAISYLSTLASTLIIKGYSDSLDSYF